MTKTAATETAARIRKQLSDEYAALHGWTLGFGSNVALGEYIVHEVDHALYEPWMVEAKKCLPQMAQRTSRSPDNATSKPKSVTTRPRLPIWAGLLCIGGRPRS